MGRRKRDPMDPAKKNIVSELIKTYDIKTAKDIQEALKDLLGETLQDMLEAEPKIMVGKFTENIYTLRELHRNFYSVIFHGGFCKYYFNYFISHRNIT